MRARGFRLRQKLVKVFKWCIHRRTRLAATYKRLKQQQQRERYTSGPVSRIRRWVWSICPARKSRSGYLPIGEGPFEKPNKLPKGHLAVYVGDKEDDTSRVLVPVICFNHPLFGELLREAERVYGYDHPGGIQIPCPRSELESIQMKIAVANGGQNWRRRIR